MVLGLKIGKNYTPKWKKKETLVEREGDVSLVDKGISGTINVVFKSGSSSLTTLANPGDPIRDIATQAGQFIKYGCGKGNCGTCQAMCGGKWIKPCVDVIPGFIPQGEDYVIEVQEVKHKAKSSGKFYSFRSFIMGFYNNLIGMIGFVKTRKAAKKNYMERIEFEDLVARKAAEKKAAKLAAQRKNERTE
jgi:uncharacterized 2Fe-2S/4Fe-4S cluster protein (DUF4445 family)